MIYNHVSSLLKTISLRKFNNPGFSFIRIIKIRNITLYLYNLSINNMKGNTKY